MYRTDEDVGLVSIRDHCGAHQGGPFASKLQHRCMGSAPRNDQAVATLNLLPNRPLRCSRMIPDGHLGFAYSGWAQVSLPVRKADGRGHLERGLGKGEAADRAGPAAPRRRLRAGRRTVGMPRAPDPTVAPVGGPADQLQAGGTRWQHARMARSDWRERGRQHRQVSPGAGGTDQPLPPDLPSPGDQRQRPRQTRASWTKPSS